MLSICHTYVAHASDIDLLTIIAETENELGIPKGLLKAIAQVESTVKAYAVNAKRKAHFFNTQLEAENFVKNSLKKGYRNISVGCLQLLYTAHKAKFNNSVGNMLNPQNNIKYAGQLLKKLYHKYGNWKAAIKRYHSHIPSKSESYYKKVTNKLGYRIA